MPESKDARSAAPDSDIVEGEIIAEFPDHTVLNLPKVKEEEPRGPAAVPDEGRRDFVLRLLVGGAAALALGGSAALLYNERRRSATPVILPYGSQVDGSYLDADPSELAQQVADLQYQLATTQAERDQALSDLDAAQTELEALRSQVADLTALNELWQELDRTGLDDLLATALGTVSTILAGAMGVLGVLNSGLNEGLAVIQRFLDAFPAPSDGIRWLSRRVSTLALDIEYVKRQVQQAVEPVEPFAQQITNFVVWVLNNLPFGLGDRARAGLEAIQAVIAGLPAMVEGIRDQVLNPLAEWFGRDQTRNLVGTLTAPIQDQVIVPGQDVVTQFTDFDAQFQATLLTPVQSALERRRAIRQQIAELEARIGVRL